MTGTIVNLPWSWTKDDSGWSGFLDRGWVRLSGSIKTVAGSSDAEVAAVAVFADPDSRGETEARASRIIRRGFFAEPAMKSVVEQVANELVRQRLLAFLAENAPAVAASSDNFEVALKRLAEDPETPARLLRLARLPRYAAQQYKLLRAGNLKAFALSLAGKALWRGLRLVAARVRKDKDRPRLTSSSGIRQRPD